MQKKDIHVGDEYALFTGYGKFRFGNAHDRRQVSRVRVTEKDVAGDTRRRSGAWSSYTATARGYNVEILDTETGKPVGGDKGQRWIENGRKLIGPWMGYAAAAAAHDQADDEKRAQVRESRERAARIEAELSAKDKSLVPRLSPFGWSDRVEAISLTLDEWERFLGLVGSDDAGHS